MKNLCPYIPRSVIYFNQWDVLNVPPIGWFRHYVSILPFYTQIYLLQNTVGQSKKVWCVASFFSPFLNTMWDLIIVISCIYYTLVSAVIKINKIKTS